MNPWRSLAENTCFDFLKPTGGFTVSRVLRSQMIYAACLILCAAGSLFTSNYADSANVFAESNITLSNGVLPIISIIQYPYINGGKPNHTISEFALNAKYSVFAIVFGSISSSRFFTVHLFHGVVPS